MSLAHDLKIFEGLTILIEDCLVLFDVLLKLLGEFDEFEQRVMVIQFVIQEGFQVGL